MGFTGAVATPHARATEAALGVYRNGGNAIDAAITAAAALTVVYPHNVALGGDLIALVRTPDGVVRCLNASGWSGSRTDVDHVRAEHGQLMPVRGPDTVTVPGGVRGWEALRTFGSRLSWSETLEPAERLAADGVPVAHSLATALADTELMADADFAQIFECDGVLRQPQLAATFRRIREHGPDEFYLGETASRSVDYLAGRGSTLAAADFAEFTPEVCTPITGEFGGLQVLTSPPNTQGFVMLRALASIERLGLADPLGEDLGSLMRIFQQTNGIRDRYLADPRYADVSLDTLLTGELKDASADGASPDGDTVGIATADSDGFAVSLIQSVYYAFGSGLVDPQTGILFHNRGNGFSLDPASPNVLAPRKRPAHTLMPVLALGADGGVRHVLATMGGKAQPQILTQVLLRLLAGASPADAIAAPRAIVGPATDSATTERDLASAATASLTRSKWAIAEMPAHSDDLGHTNVVTVHQPGLLAAASDPRSDGAALVAHFPNR